jgi:hypothetical protein
MFKNKQINFTNFLKMLSKSNFRATAQKFNQNYANAASFLFRPGSESLFGSPERTETYVSGKLQPAEAGEFSSGSFHPFIP